MSSIENLREIFNKIIEKRTTEPYQPFNDVSFYERMKEVCKSCMNTNCNVIASQMALMYGVCPVSDNYLLINLPRLCISTGKKYTSIYNSFKRKGINVNKSMTDHILL